MSHDPKLEVFKLNIFKKEDGRPITFREFFRLKSNYYHKVTQPTNDDEILQYFFKDFVKDIDLKKYNTYEKKKKAFVIDSNKENGKIKSKIILSTVDKA